MNGNIFNEKTEDYLRKIIEAEENQEKNSKQALEKIIAPQEDIREVPGSKSISLEMLPSRGIFYPDDLLVTVFPLKVKQIRHFSSIDENDEIDILSKLNFVINAAVRVQTREIQFSPSSLLDIDRLYLLFVVRNITFIEFPSVISVKSTCEHCDHTDVVDVRADRLGSMKEGALDEYLRYYSMEHRCILQKVGNEVIKLYLPSIENLETARREVIGSNISENDQDRFMLCFLVPPWKKLKASDFLTFERELEEWSPDKYMSIRSFVSTVNSSYSVDVYYRCSSCDAGVVTPLRFHGGIKELFVPELSNRPI